MLAERKTKLKPLLMDQKFIAGIGNVYSDEILFEAGLKWERQSDSLSQQEVRRLYRAISETLQGAVKYRGLVAGRRAATSTCSASPASTRTTTRCTAAKARRAIAAGARSTGPATRTGRPSTATRARSDRAADPAARAIRVRVIVTGRVQGVWFRDSCRDAGPQPSGVSGFARNRADGAVEVEFEGPEPAVERMIAWCRVGPPRPGSMPSTSNGSRPSASRASECDERTVHQPAR